MECGLCRENLIPVLYYNMAAAYARKNNFSKALANLKKAVRIGGRKVIEDLKKDEDKDFCNLYENSEFQQIRKGKLEGKKKVTIKSKK